MMDIVKLIEKKRDGFELSSVEIDEFVRGVMTEEIEPCQIGALLMAITSNGLSATETYFYAKALAESGTMIKISEHADKVVDKHSTGGVTDSCTLVVLPVLAALGLKVGKYSTKEVGASFGTLDRLCVFKGYQPVVSMKKFYEIIDGVGISVIGASDKIIPADTKLYEYRKLTGTVPSIPLVAASIMAKKIAMGAKTVVIDVKCGEGSLMVDYNQAERLAKLIVEVGKLAGMNISAIISNLNQPLGRAIGPKLEVKEALELLRGDEDCLSSDLYKMCKEMVSHILISSGEVKSRRMAGERFDDAIKSGQAFIKLKQMIQAHGGDCSYFDDTEKLIPDVNSFYIVADRSGYLYDIDLKGLYKAINVLGLTDSGKVNQNVGVELMVREGEKIFKGDKLALVYYALDDPSFASAVSYIRKCFKIEKVRPANEPSIYKLIN